MSLKPSNMISMQFLTMTVHLIIKFRVDPSSRNCFLTCLSKIIKLKMPTICASPLGNKASHIKALGGL